MAIQQMLWFKELINNPFTLATSRLYTHFTLVLPSELDRIFPLDRCRNRGLKRLTNLGKVTQLVCSGAGTTIQVLTSYPYCLLKESFHLVIQAGTMEVILISHSPILPKHLQQLFPFLTYYQPGLDDHGFIQQPPTIGLSASGLPL